LACHFALAGVLLQWKGTPEYGQTSLKLLKLSSGYSAGGAGGWYLGGGHHPCHPKDDVSNDAKDDAEHASANESGRLLARNLSGDDAGLR
jgi:hypothetical protein